MRRQQWLHQCCRRHRQVARPPAVDVGCPRCAAPCRGRGPIRGAPSLHAPSRKTTPPTAASLVGRRRATMAAVAVVRGHQCTCRQPCRPVHLMSLPPLLVIPVLLVRRQYPRRLVQLLHTLHARRRGRTHRHRMRLKHMHRHRRRTRRLAAVLLPTRRGRRTRRGRHTCSSSRTCSSRRTCTHRRRTHDTRRRRRDTRRHARRCRRRQQPCRRRRHARQHPCCHHPPCRCSMRRARPRRACRCGSACCPWSAWG